MKKVIITGGTGTIGRALIPLLQSEYEIVVLSRSPEKHSIDGVEIVQWDAKTADGWGHHVDGAYGIINLAGAGIADKKWSKERKVLILDSRVNATNAIVDAVKKATNKPEVVVQGSAIGFYGSRGNASPIDESGAVGSDFLADVTAKWEASAQPLADLGIRIAIARTGVVFTMDGGALPKMVQPVQSFIGGKLGDGTQMISWIHLIDEVRALKFLLDHTGCHGIYNLVAPAAVPNAFLMNCIGLQLKRPTLVPAPALALKMMLGEMSTIVLDGANIVSTKLQRDGFTFHYTNVQVALADLLKTSYRLLGNEFI